MVNMPGPPAWGGGRYGDDAAAGTAAPAPFRPPAGARGGEVDRQRRMRGEGLDPGLAGLDQESICASVQPLQLQLLRRVARTGSKPLGCVADLSGEHQRSAVGTRQTRS